MKLIIFAGITGFNKTQFIQNFMKKSLQKNGLSDDFENEKSRSFIHYIKFEDELLEVTHAISIPDFLKKSSWHEKIREIERTFQRIGDKIEENEAEYIFLDIHLSYLYHSQFFPPIYLANLKELDPLEKAQIKIITLIDDVFNIWKKLKEREAEFPGTSLRLREILSWRSIEQLQTEAIAFNYSTENRGVENYLFSVRHPFDTLYNLIFTDKPICIYLSYPITATRFVPDRIRQINDFRRRMNELTSRLGVVVFDPVTIDELALEVAPTIGAEKVLEAQNRWPLETELMLPEPEWPISIPQKEVEEALPDIRNNVRPRDFKLIDNAIFTTVFRKNYGGLSRGVLDEIQYTTYRGKRAYVYDPIEDHLIPEKPHPFDQDEIGYRNIEDFYKAIESGLEFYRARRRK